MKIAKQLVREIHILIICFYNFHSKTKRVDFASMLWWVLFESMFRSISLEPYFISGDTIIYIKLIKVRYLIRMVNQTPVELSIVAQPNLGREVGKWGLNSMNLRCIWLMFDKCQLLFSADWWYHRLLILAIIGR